jgi:hypothetical protein
MLRAMGLKRWHLLLALACLFGSAQGARPMDPLQNVTSMRWIARQGYLEVIADPGKTEYRFNHHLQLTGARAVGSDQTVEPAAADSVATGQEKLLEIRGPGGRTIRWHPDRQILVMSPSTWENTGEFEWGPDWARVEFRSGRSLGPWLQWINAQGQMNLVRITEQWPDPTRQRAYLRDIHGGQAIRLRHRPLGYQYPHRPWTEWVDLVVPEVDPAGLRPTSRLPE